MITNEELKKLSKLARIEISEGELNNLSKDINSILDYVGQIQQISVDINKKEELGVLKNVMREDEKPHKSGEFSPDLLKEAPYIENEYVKVKKIL